MSFFQIPTGFRNKAQGCALRATLGKCRILFTTPRGNACKLKKKIEHRAPENQRKTRERPENILFSSSGSLVLCVLSGCPRLKFTGIAREGCVRAKKWTCPKQKKTSARSDSNRITKNREPRTEKPRTAEPNNRVTVPSKPVVLF
jgi:flagellar biosynthesis component FlhA